MAIPGRAALSLAAALFTACALPLAAQPAYRYEVVSIKRAAPDQNSSGFSPGPQGGLRGRNVTPLTVLGFCYGVQDNQILGAPPWAKTERFEITFTPDKTEIVPGPEVSRAAMDGWLTRQRERMKAVLFDRFQLALHEETREMPGYVLMVAKGGHKLAPPANPGRTQTMNINNGRQLIATATPVKALAEALAMVLGHPVRDETGIEGTFDFRMDWTPDSTVPDENAGPSIFTAITEKLGLRLESKKGPVTVYVIDKLDRPTEN